MRQSKRDAFGDQRSNRRFLLILAQAFAIFCHIRKARGACGEQIPTLLIYRENEAHRNGVSDAVTAAARLKKRLLEEQLGLWIPPFTAALNAGAQTAFYHQLAELTERFVKVEATE